MSAPPAPARPRLRRRYVGHDPVPTPSPAPAPVTPPGPSRPSRSASAGGTGPSLVDFVASARPAPAEMRLAAGVGALVLAVTSTGHGVLLAVLLGVAAWSPVAAVTALLAVAAGLRRWGSVDLGDWAGAQAVVGLGAASGPTLAVAGAWLAAVALLGTARAGPVERSTATGPPRSGDSGPPDGSGPSVGSGRVAAAGRRMVRLAPVVVAVPAGVAAVLPVVGPGPGGPLALRVAAAAVGIALALALATARRRPAVDRTVGVGALVLGAVAVALTVAA